MNLYKNSVNYPKDAPKNIEYPVGFNLPASYWDSDDDRRDKFDCYYCLSLVGV